MYVYRIRTLGSLPWPPGLGKNGRYRDLRKLLQAHLGEDLYHSPEAHQHALLNGDNEYRRIVLEQLARQPWAADILEGYDEATRAARSAPLLNQRQENLSGWLDWARPYQNTPAGRPIWCSLTDPIEVGPDEKIANGRHRLTYLRYHRPAHHEVIVQHDLDEDESPESPMSKGDLATWR